MWAWLIMRGWGTTRINGCGYVVVSSSVGGSVGVAIQQSKMADNSLDEKEEDFASAESDQEEKVS